MTLWLLLLWTALAAGIATCIVLLVPTVPPARRAPVNPVNPLKAYAPCRLVADGPVRLYVCSDGRAHVHSAAGWVDAGPVSSGVQVPAA